jgi:tetratricopeptide (TPR) repeat protein
MVAAGRISQATNDPDTAKEKFEIVVRDYVGTPSYLPGLLGLAETQSILGDHEQSLLVYETLKDELARSHKRRDITSLVVARSLCDRHDAALALGNLERALSYVSLAESLFKQDEVIADVSLRLASTHRQLADNILALARSGAAAATPSAVPVEIRTLANEHYTKAAEFYLQHANSHDAARLDDREWATSLWLAADSFDEGGRQDQAAKYFLRYLDGGAIDDPRRPETLFRVGQAYQAQLDYENGAAFYEQLVADHPRSTYAAHAHVPLSQCYVALDRRTEAEQQLRDVLSGNRLLTPEAQDYRDALFELGSLHYAAGEFAPAIERYTEASERYPDDQRRMEILYRLADSYRGSAMDLEERLKQPPPLPPSEQGRVNAQRMEQLQRALDLFAEVCDTYGASLVAADAAQVGSGSRCAGGGRARRDAGR